MSDLISREAALDCFHDWVDKYGDVHAADEMVEYQRIEALPAVQRVESVGMRWIPCAERLPEAEVLCCDNRKNQMIGYVYADEQSDSGYTAECEGSIMYNCMAWMPLPECYGGD